MGRGYPEESDWRPLRSFWASRGAAATPTTATAAQPGTTIVVEQLAEVAAIMPSWMATDTDMI